MLFVGMSEGAEDMAAPAPPAMPMLPVMASIRSMQAWAQWPSFCWSPMPLPQLMAMGLMVPIISAICSICSTGMPVISLAHSGVLSTRLSASSSKPLHQFSTKSWS